MLGAGAGAAAGACAGAGAGAATGVGHTYPWEHPETTYIGPYDRAWPIIGRPQNPVWQPPPPNRPEVAVNAVRMTSEFIG
jgi:hypothetical protein